MMMQFDTPKVAAAPAAPDHRDLRAARSAPKIDLDRVVWDQEYRQEVLQALKAGN
jgi:hypothetical protein